MQVARRSTRLLCCVYALLIGWCSAALTCPSGLHSFPPDSCVSLSEGTRDSCSAGTTLAVLAQTQIDVLGHYAAAVLEGSQLMWLGYSYSNGDLIQDGQERYNSLPSSFFTNESNFDLNASENISNDTCIAVNQLSKLVRRPCGETLKWSLCMIIYDPGSFFLGNSTVGNTLILRCPRNDSVSWLLSQGDNLPMEISNGANPLVVSDFSETTNGGLYFCVNTNAFGSFVYFQRVLSLSSFGAISLAYVIPSVPEVYNMAVNYTCGAPLMSNMSTLWFIDGALSSIRDEVLQVDRERAGFYTCVHFTNGVRYANNRNVVPQPGVPGSVDLLSVEPTSSASLSVQWLCPQPVATHDPVLLVYQISYYFSSPSTALNQTVRAADNMVGNDACQVRAELDGLMEGMTYFIKVRAFAGSNPGQQAVITGQGTTFGQAPGAISNFQVSRTEKTLQAKWDKLETTPPVGVVEVYHIEYRQYTKKSVSSILKFPDQTSVEIFNIVDTDSYELRVRAGVLASSNPISYNYGPFTGWKRVADIKAVTEGVRAGSSPNAAIVGGVVGGVLGVALLAVIVTVVALVWNYCNPQSQK